MLPSGSGMVWLQRSSRLVLRPPHLHPPLPVALARTLRVPLARRFASSSPPTRSLLARLLPTPFRPSPDSGSSLRKVIALAKPEKKPLLLAICLILVSSSVSMAVPLTVGKLIDFFSASDPVSGPFGVPHMLVPTSTTCSIYRTDSRSTRRQAYSSSRSRPAPPATPPDRSLCACLVRPFPVSRFWLVCS